MNQINQIQAPKAKDFHHPKPNTFTLDFRHMLNTHKPNQKFTFLIYFESNKKNIIITALAMTTPVTTGTSVT